MFSAYRDTRCSHDRVQKVSMVLVLPPTFTTRHVHQEGENGLYDPRPLTHPLAAGTKPVLRPSSCKTSTEQHGRVAKGSHNGQGYLPAKE